jgi:tetratricopeptide (TPR) repeat protein
MYRYRVAYSNTNLALANSLASKEELTDKDRQDITQLISQSIREGKAAVALNPLNSSAWVNLASIYRQLINFAQGSDQWAVSSYIQAIRLDKTNPQLRLDLGGLLFSLQQYEDAIDQYKQAISLKSDMANAYYNLSFAYRQLEKYPESYASLQNVVNLLDPSSADYEKASQELAELQKLLPQQPATDQQAPPQESQLSLPEPVPTPDPEQETPVIFDETQQAELEPEEVTPLDEPLEEDIPESTQSAQPEE